LACGDLPPGITLDSNTDHWGGWFSEENDGEYHQDGEGWGSGHFQNELYCNYHAPGVGDTFGAALVGGYQCSGSYCDNQNLECDVPRHSDGSWAVFSNCHWTTAWVSEETGPVAFGGGYVAGVRCSGSYCDNKE